MCTLHSKARVAMFVAAIAVLAPAGVYAGQVEKIGRVEFDFPNAPQANVEVDLKSGMLSALTDIANAAVEGVAEGLVESSEADAVRESVDHLNALKEILGVASHVIQEVRVRVYENLPDNGIHAPMVKHYQKKLEGTSWENVIRVKEEGENVIVCVQQHESAIRGVFVMVSDGDELILANVVCELTPERVKQLAHQATKIGMKFGMEQAIEEAMREVSKVH